MIRIAFEKSSTAIYMSHLDLMRCMTRALTRAEIPAKYTEGFNPHLYLVFAAPLALGITGEREYFEIKLTEDMAPEQIRQRLNATLPRGLKILDVFEAENDFNEIESADYRVFIEGKTAEDWNRFFSAPTIPTEKKTKRGMETVDLKAEIISCRAEDTENGVVLSLHLPCGNRKNLSPLLVVKTFAPNEETYYTAARCAFFDQKGKRF
ncbi:MAG: DUF2344 domain-containing protein [Clostridia bacterium]|nr:DUF2344 domain-containing protein [Clostridia bacterium]